MLREEFKNGYCTDEFNTEECVWDGDDCCGSDVKTVDSDGNPTGDNAPIYDFPKET